MHCGRRLELFVYDGCITWREDSLFIYLVRTRYYMSGHLGCSRTRPEQECCVSGWEWILRLKIWSNDVKSARVGLDPY